MKIRERHDSFRGYLELDSEIARRLIDGPKWCRSESGSIRSDQEVGTRVVPDRLGLRHKRCSGLPVVLHPDHQFRSLTSDESIQLVPDRRAKDGWNLSHATRVRDDPPVSINDRYLSASRSTSGLLHALKHCQLE